MIGRTISHYRILEELGRGGMGVVYRAEDLRLKRIVALKFLQPQAFGDKEQRDRFLREAQAAAALDHPNICTIYEIEETGDDIFIAMAHIEGVTLKERIQSGRIDIGEALRMSIQVARGLKAAHARGVIHRDIKSTNIMVTNENHVKIMDFGLAKIAGGKEISKTTMSVGTASYMSPEQGRGENADERTDIWSLGVVMYEMLTGELPFDGDYDPAVIYALLNQIPTDIHRLRPEVPTDLEAIVTRAMQKDPDARYQTACEILAHLKATGLPLGFDPAGGNGAVALRPSIVVLPFVDLSPERDQEYFCDGIAEEIINALTRVDGLRVVSRTSAFSFKGKHVDVRDIGRKLNVETVLEGSVRKAGKRIRVTGQLVSVFDGYHLWSAQFDRELEDVFAIQEEIAENIVEALQVSLDGKGKPVLGRIPTQNVQAYDYYLRGRRFFYQSKRKGMDFACEMFAKAIKKDAKYALAYAGLADCHSFLCLYFGGGDEHRKKALEAAVKALVLDRSLAEAHAAHGLALSVNGEHDRAEKEFEKAIELDPKLFEAYYFYARMAFACGKKEKAIEMYHRAGVVNPDDYLAPSLEAFTYRTMNRMDESREAYRRSLGAIKRHVELHPDDSHAIFLGALALLDLEERSKALLWVRRAQAIDPGDPYLLYGMGCFYCRIGDTDVGFRYLEKAIGTGFSHREWIDNDIDLDSVRDHPRFKRLLERLV